MQFIEDTKKVKTGSRNCLLWFLKPVGLISLVFLLYLNNPVPTHAQEVFLHGRILVSGNGHFLQYEDGTPFFWLGDTGWELFHRLTLEEINRYFENRAQKGFSVIQAVLLAEMEGLTRPNRYGDLPLLNCNPDTPNEKYFIFVDSVIRLAESKNLYIGLLPAWGDKVTKMWGAGPAVFNSENAFRYGKWLGTRYRDYPNILWILGGDRPPVTDSVDYRPVWRAMAMGIKEGAGNNAFITYHPWGGDKSTSQYIHTENWLSMNMIQSGHGSGHDVPIWSLISRDWNLKPSKPVLDAEPNYEDHPVNPWPEWNPANGYFRAYDVRKQTYRSVFSGGCGVTYGHHSIWQFWSPREEKINHADRYWTDALDRPGAFQVGYLKRLIESRPQLTRVPDQELILKGQGEKGEYITAFRDSSFSYLMLYMPVGKTITVNLASMKSEMINVWWFNPINGETVPAGSTNRRPSMDFTPPTLGVGNDWVLVVDDPSFHYKAPGGKYLNYMSRTKK